MPNNRLIGQQGEQQAVDFLKKKQYQIWSQNYSFQNKEIDIIAFDVINQEIVFIEVKTRTDTKFGNPFYAVDKNKMSGWELVAQHFITDRNLNYNFRFDIITILPDSIEHFENITWT